MLPTVQLNMKPAFVMWQLFIVVLARIATVHGGCPDGFAQYKSQCYHLSIESLDHETAVDYCSGLGAYLARPPDPETNAFIGMLATRYSYVWIGLEADTSGSEPVWSWDDGSDVTYTKPWYLNQPSDSDTHAVLSASGFWSVQSSDSLKYAVCETEAEGAEECSMRIFMIQNVQVTDNDMITVADSTVTSCLAACVSEASITCRSVEFQQSTGTCVLSDADETSAGVTAANGWDVFQIYCQENAAELYASDEVQSAGGPTFSASSSWYPYTQPDQGRLFQRWHQDPDEANYGVWVASSHNEYNWFEVDMNVTVQVDVVASQGVGLKSTSGGSWSNARVLTYRLLYSQDRVIWYYYSEVPDEAKDIPGTWDTNVPRAYLLKTPIIARYLRVNPRTRSAYPALRFGAFGISQPEAFQAPGDFPYGRPLGMEDGYITDAQISSSDHVVSGDISYPAWTGRLNFPSLFGPLVGGAWRGTTWFMVDLLVMHEITAVALQGYTYSSSLYYVDSFNIFFKEDGDYVSELVPLTDHEGNTRVFHGVFEDSMSIVIPVSNLTARMVRIVPVLPSSTLRGLRMELFGRPVANESLPSSEVSIVPDQSGCTCSDHSTTTWCSTPGPLQVSLPYLYIVSGLALTAPEAEVIQVMEFEYSSDLAQQNWATHSQDEMVVTNATADGQTTYWIQFLRARRLYFLNISLTSVADVSCGTVVLFGQLAAVCPPRYVHHKGRCYWSTLDQITMDTEEMRGICGRTSWVEPGYLATLNDPEEQHFVWLNSRGYYYDVWLGLFGTNESDPWLGNVTKPSWTWRWMDGSSRNDSIIYWDGDAETGQPDEAQSDETCTILKSNMVHDVPCTEAYQYTCETPAALVPGNWERCGWIGTGNYYANYPTGSNEYEDVTTSDVNDCMWRCLHSTTIQCKSSYYYWPSRQCRLSVYTKASLTMYSNVQFTHLQPYCQEPDELALLWGPQGLGAEYLSGMQYLDDHAPMFAIYGHPSLYYKATGSADRLQVDLSVKTRVDRIAMQGAPRPGGTCSVRTYRVWFSNNSVYWEVYRTVDAYTYKDIMGAQISSVTEVEFLSPPIYARFLRLETKSAISAYCMRIEIYGAPTLPDEARDKGCAVEMHGYGNQGYLRYGFMNINGREYMDPSPTQGLHLLRFEINEATCTTNHSVEVFDVATSEEEKWRLWNYTSALPNGSYIMGNAITNLGTTFHEMQDTFLDFGVNVANMTVSYRSLLFVARKGAPNWVKQVWGYQSTSSSIGIWRHLRAFPEDDITSAPIGLESGSVRHAQLFDGFGSSNVWRGRLFDVMTDFAYMGGWTRGSVGQCFGVDLGVIHILHGVIIQGVLGNRYFTTITVAVRLTADENALFSADETGTDITYSAALNGYNAFIVRFRQPMRGRICIICPDAVSGSASMRAEILGYPEQLPAIDLEQPYTTIRSQGDDPDCDVEEMLYKLWSPDCDRWCPETFDIWIEIHTERWYQLSGFEIEQTPMQDGNLTYQFDVYRQNFGHWVSLRDAPPKAFQDFREYSSDNLTLTVVFSPLLLTDSLRVEINISLHVCLSLVLHGKEAPACPVGWLQFGTKCFDVSRYSAHVLMNQWECEEEDWISPSHLADIITKEDAMDARVISSGARVGLYRGEDNAWKWSNGTNATDIPWGYYANPDTTTHRCAYVDYYGRLRDANCWSNMYSICETRAYVALDADCLDTWHVDDSYYMSSYVGFYYGVLQYLCMHYCTEVTRCRAVDYYSYSNSRYCYLVENTRYNGTLHANGNYKYYERMCIDRESFPLLQTYGHGREINLTASASQGGNLAPEYGIIYSPYSYGWAYYTTVDYTAIFTITFGGHVKIDAMSTQGMTESHNYYPSYLYLMSYNSPCPGWETSASESGTPKYYRANMEQYRRSRWPFPAPFVATIIDLRVARAAGTYYQSGRFEFYGYYISATDAGEYIPLGMESRYIKDAQIGSSNYLHTSTILYPPYLARLNMVSTYWTYSSFRLILGQSHWLSVSLYAQYNITGILTQSSPAETFWTQTYEIYYKNTENTSFVLYAHASGLMVFSGPYSSTSIANRPAYQKLSPQIITDVIRLVPISYGGSGMSLRCELYGHAKDGTSVEIHQMSCDDSQDPCEEWCPVNGMLPLLSLDLGSYHHVSSININGTNDLTYFNMAIYYAVDPSNWTEMDSNFTRTSQQNTTLRVAMLHHFNARYIKIESVDVEFDSCLVVTVHGEQMQACPPDFVPYGDKCYVIHSVPSSLAYAKYHCQGAGESWVGGGELARVDTDDKMAFLGTILQLSWRPFDLRIGGDVTNTTTPRSFIYQDGTPVSFIRNLTAIPSSAPLPLSLGMSEIEMVEVADQTTGFICQIDAADDRYKDIKWSYLINVDVAIPEVVYLDETLVNKTQCLHKCIRAGEENCSSLAFDEGTQRCVLMYENRYSAELIVGDGTWQYYDMANEVGCGLPLLQSNFHRDLTASSELSADYAVRQAIYGLAPNGTNTGGWRAATDDLEQYITIVFPVTMVIAAMTVSGSYSDVNSGRITQFSFSVKDGSAWVPLQDSSDGDEMFAGSHHNLLGLTHSFPSQPKGSEFQIVPYAFVTHVAFNLELYGCVHAALPTCFSSIQSEVGGGTECLGDWIVILRREGEFVNPGLSPADYTGGFNETNFMWYGTQAIFSLTNDAIVNMRIEMWTDGNEFYYAEYLGVILRDLSAGYGLEIENFRDGSHGDGGLIHVDNTVPFVTTDTFNINDTDCATEDGPVFGWWIYWIECNQTLLTADAGAQWLAEGILPTDISIVVMDKVIMRVSEADTSSVNVALNKPSSQSSTVHAASLANDASIKGDGAAGDCAQTEAGDNPWWKVDLLKVFRIRQLIIQGRGDCCYGELHDFDVLVGDVNATQDFTNSGYQLCAHYTGAYDGDNINLACTELLYGRFLVITMTTTNEVLTLCEVTVFTASDDPSPLHAPCSWGGDCGVRYTACVPANGSRAEIYTCQCKPGYRETDLGQCLPEIDISLKPGEISFGDAADLVREMPTSMTVTLNMTHGGGPPLAATPTDLTNFLLEVVVTNGGTAPFDRNFTTDIEVTEGWDSRIAFSYPAVLTLSLSLEGSIPADACHYASHICFHVVPGNASEPGAYTETQPSNDYACFSLVNLEALICQPEMDVLLDGIRYISPHSIVRATSGMYEFSMDVTHVTGTYAIAELQYDYNYVMEYAYSSAELTAMTTADSPMTVPEQDGRQTALEVGQTRTLNITVPESMAFEGCADVTHICFQLHHDPLASYLELDGTLADNIACLDITSFKVCEPEMLIQINSVEPAASLSIIRGYEDVVTIPVTITNADVLYDVPAVTNPAQNFNITASCSGASVRKRRALRSDIHRDGRSRRAVAEAGPFIALSDASTSSALVRGDTMTLNASIGILLPRDICDDFNELCITVEPGIGASYSVYPGNDHIFCIDINPYKNCLGLDTEDVLFQPSSPWLPEGGISNISVAWSVGTDVEFTVDFQDGSPYNWTWYARDHTLSYGELSTVVTHTYETYANYTLSLHICSSVGCKDYFRDVVVEPPLEKYLVVKLDYTPKPPPTATRFTVQLINETLYPVLARCTFTFNDANDIENVTVYTSITGSGIGVNHIYQVVKPTAFCEIFCENHVSEVTFNVTVALQENITGLVVAPVAIAVLTNALAEVELSVVNGSNIVFEIDYGDDTTETVDNSDSYVHQDDLTVSHQYSAAGNYTVSVTASNVHFNDSAVSVRDVIVQNEVTQMSVDCVTPVTYPPGDITCNLEPDTAIAGPTDPFCDSQLDGVITSLGTHLPALGSQTPVEYTFQADYSQINPNVTVDIYCHNLVSSQNLQFVVGIYEEILGLGVDMENMGLVAGELGTLYFAVTNGSSVEFQIDFGDGNSVTAAHPLLFASEEPLVVSNTYTAIGNYTVDITAANLVSDMVVTIPEPVVVQHRITDMTLDASESILWPREPLTYILRVLEAQEPLYYIHCSWYLNGMPNIYRYLENPVTNDDIVIVEDVFRQHLGNLSINVTCNNLVSSISLPESTNVILDAVILSDLRSNGSVWWQNVSGLVLDVARFAEYSCFLWDMGDAAGMFLYGVASCETDATSGGWPFTEIEDGTMTIGQDYIYETFGRYIVSVFAYNDVSNHTLETRAVVWEWTCLTPNISVNYNDSDTTNPVVKFRSEYFIIHMSLETHCFYTWKTEDLWQFTDANTGDEYFTLTDLVQFIHYPRTMLYGLYEVLFSTQMRNFPDTANSLVMYLEIIKTPLNVSIVGGDYLTLNFGVSHLIDAISLTSDPDVEPGDLSGITFSWTCMQYNTSNLENAMRPRFENYNNTFPPNRTNLCLQYDPQISASNDGSITINTGNMFPMVLHEIAVTVSKDTRENTFEQFMYIDAPAAPTIEITCRDNCADKAASSRPIVLKLTCMEACSNIFGGFFVQWILYNGTSTDQRIANLSQLTINGVNQLSIFLRENSLPGGLSYRMVAEGWTPGSLIASAHYDFKVNLVPFNGMCDVDPKEGIASVTQFILSCENWLEWEPPEDSQLEYFFYVRQLGSLRLFPVFFGLQERSSPVVFPVGSLQEEFNLESVIRIYDSVGDYEEFVITVIVRPKEEPGDVVLNAVLAGVAGEDSAVQIMLNNGATQEAAAMLFAFISEINVPADMYGESSDGAVDIPQLRRETRTNTIRMSTNFEVDSVGSLLQNNEIMRTSLLLPEEVEVDALEMASGHLSMLSTNTLDFNSQGDIDNPTLVATDVVDTSIKVMLSSESILVGASAVNDSETDSGFNETFGQVSNVMENVVVIIDDIMGMLNEGMEANDPAAVLEYDELTVMTSKLSPAELNEVDFGTNQGGLQLPSVSTLLGNNLPSCLRNQALFSGINPFIYGPQQDTAIGSSVLEFLLEECDTPVTSGRRRREAVANSPLQPQVPFAVSVVPSTMDEPYLVDRNLTSLNEYQYHILELSEPNVPVQIDIYPYPWNTTLVAAIGLNMLPSLWESTWSSVLTVDGMSNNSAVPVVRHEGDYYSLYIPASNLTNGTLRVAVSIPDCSVQADTPCPSESEPVPLTYTIRLMEVTCQVWNDTSRIWSNDNCELEGPVSQTSAVFTSNLFGSLGVGVFVGPNTIDFSTVFNNLDQAILENLPVFLTVTLVMLLYIPLVVICRKYDKKDELKWKVLPLLGTSTSSSYHYELHMFTGFKKYSETESNIKVVLIGTKGDSGILRLTDGVRKNFNRGDVNSFTVGIEEDLGGVYMIRVWHDNSGEGQMASWFLSKVIVVDVKRSHWYLFLCNKWLAEDQEDGLTDRVIRVSSKESMDSGYIMRTNMNRKFYEDHIWLSIIFRQVYSPFTRVQRLSTAWALLFLTMIANAMWYRSSTESSDPVIFSIGIVSFTTYQLYSSFMSSLMVVPPILIISHCYGKATAKPKPKTQQDDISLKSQAEFDGISKLSPSRQSSILTADYLIHDEIALQPKDENTVRKEKGKWPHWVVYIAWILVVLSVLASAFFTILYSFEWGGSKSSTWLIAFLLSFFQSVIIIQPIKVMCVAMILTLLFQRDTDMNPYEERYGEMKDSMDIFSAADCTVNKNPWCDGVDDVDSSHLQRKRTLEKRMIALIQEIAHQVVFLILILAVCYSNQDDSIYQQNECLQNHFLGNITSVTSRSTAWWYLESSVVPNMFWESLDNGDLVDDYNNQFITDMAGYRLGQPRIRQLRVVPEVCDVPLAMEEVTARCTYRYASHSPPLDKGHYLPHWRIPTNSSEITHPATAAQTAFLYSTADDINGAPLWANLHIYDGGGYVAVLGGNLDEGLQTVHRLIHAHWIDQYTRAVFVEFSVLNMNSNLFSMITIVFEFPPVGGAFVYFTFETIKLYRYIGADGLLVLALEIITFLFFISVIYKFIKRCIKDKMAFLCSLWGVTYLIVIISFLTAVTLYTLRSIWTVSTLEEVMNNRDRGVSFSRVLVVDSAFMLLMALVCFLVQMQFLYILRFSQSINVMGNTILKAKGDLASLGLFSLTLVIGFASMGHMMYGAGLELYRTMADAFMTLCVCLIGKFDMESHYEVGGMGAKVFLTIYLLGGMIVLMDFFITLLNEFMSEINSDADRNHPDKEVMDHLINNIKSFFLNSESSSSATTKLKKTKKKVAFAKHSLFWHGSISVPPRKCSKDVILSD